MKIHGVEMMMELSGKTCAISALKEDVLVCPVAEGGAVPGELKEFARNMAKAQFSGKSGETWSATTLGKAGFARLLLVGMGKADELELDAFRKLGGTAVRHGTATKSRSVAIFLPKFARIRNADAAQATAEGAMLASYKFTKFKTNKEDIYELPRAAIVSEAGAEGVKTGALLAGAQNYVRGLDEAPANLATPSAIADEARRLAKEKGFSCRVYGREEMKKMGMNALLGVAQGSVQPPALVALEYGTRGPLLAIVGKGITFDSGGISIKPSKGMQEMKYDKSGALVVLGVFKAAAELRLPVRLLGLMPLTENLPSGSAQRPGDIVAAYNGKTIEVLNTDAEGRLVLADALAFAAEKKPAYMISIATLTGAVIVALGRQAAAVLSNDERLAKALEESGARTFERLWRLPLWKEYSDMMKGDFADLKNSSETGEAGTITGAAFLKEFVGETKWAHIDIAGMDMINGPHPYLEKGASGIGVRLLVDAVSTLARK
jgi:leucyl aminopeptidase